MASVAVVDARAALCGVTAAPRPEERPARRKVASRAYWKLDEALERFGAEDSTGAAPANGRGAPDLTGARALDLGAAPGGWTEALLDRGAAEVVAIDPGALDEAVAARPGVAHVRELFADARAGLEGPFDAFVCDACLHEPGAAVDALESFGPSLAPGALVVVAVKLTNPGKSTAHNDRLAEEHVRRLRPLLDGAEVYHLLASRSRERTVVGRWRGKS